MPWGRLVAVVVLFVLTFATSANAAYRSPGYKGVRKAPRTLPPPAPTPIPLGNGQRPQVHVDAAGTGHITWLEERGNAAADVVRYCRLKRGATACDASKELVPSGPDDGRGDPSFNSESGTPQVFALGDQVAVVTHRYPQPFIPPDGVGFEESTLWLFVSNDGGDTWQDGVIAGMNQTSGLGTVFGPPDSPRIGLISDTQTGGPFFQEITGGRFQRKQADLGDDGVSSSLAPFGTGVIAAFYDLRSALVHVRAGTGQGDIHDQATWTDTTFSGDEPRIASGPSGTFVLSTPPCCGGDERFDVRPVAPDGRSVGAPVPIPGTENVGIADLFQDPSGKLLVTYRKGNAQFVANELWQTTSVDGGRTWSVGRLFHTSPPNQSISKSDQAATADGGGFALTHDTESAREGAITARAFGPQTATGIPGLGSESGGAAPPDVVEGCSRFEFQQVDVVAPEGCLLGVRGKPGVRVSEGTLKLNGLEIVPDAGVQILVNARARTIDTTGRVSVQLRAPGIPPIVLLHDELHINLNGERANVAEANGSGCSGQLLANFDGGALLKGFPISGSIAVYLQPDSVCIPVSLELPKVFGGIRGAAVLRANNRSGLVLDSLKIDVDQAFIGPLLIKDVLIEYQSLGDEWRGEATLALPPQPGGIELGAKVKFAEGNFKEGALALTFPFPGIGLDPFAVSYLRQIRGGFGLDPVSINAGVTVGLIPLPPSAYLFEVDGDIKITFGDPIVLDVTGAGRILTFPLAEMAFTLNTDGFAKASGRLSVNLGVSITAQANAFVDLPSGTFGIGGKASVLCFDGEDDCVAEAEITANNKGIAGCVSPPVLPDVGASLDWGDILPTPFFYECDLDPYRTPAPARARAAQAGGQSFVVAPGTKVVNVRVTGTGGAPDVVVVSPSGERIEPLADVGAARADTRALAASYGDVTFVGVNAPAAGTWQVVPKDGSSAIAALATRTDVPAPVVAGSVGGRGYKRLVSYRATTGNGLKTTIVETGPMGSRVLGVAKGARGTIRFAPAPGPRGKRTIEAIVERDGMPRLRKAIGSYTAPPTRKPGKVRALKVVRRGTAVTARWRKGARATTYAVRFDLPDGRRLLKVGKPTRSTFRGAPRKGRVRVTVVARDRGGRRSPAVSRTRR